MTGVKKGHPLISKANKVYEKVDGALDKVDQAKDIANGEIPTGGGKKNKNKNKDKDKDKDEKDNGGDNNNGGKGKDDNKSQCKKITIKMSAKTYPEELAPMFPMTKAKETWPVSTETRKECKVGLKEQDIPDGTVEYGGYFAEKVNEEGLTQVETEYLNNMLNMDVSSMGGEEIVSHVSAFNTNLGNVGPTNKSNYHHLRPRWAYGDKGNGGNEVGNLFPVNPRHQTKEGIHGWWNKQLDAETKKVKDQLNKCPKLKKCKNKIPAKGLNECSITTLSKCISNADKKTNPKLVVSMSRT